MLIPNSIFLHNTGSSPKFTEASKSFFKVRKGTQTPPTVQQPRTAKKQLHC